MCTFLPRFNKILWDELFMLFIIVSYSHGLVDYNYTIIKTFFSSTHRLQSPLASTSSSGLTRKPSNVSETKRRDSKPDSREPFRL